MPYRHHSCLGRHSALEQHNVVCAVKRCRLQPCLKKAAFWEEIKGTKDKWNSNLVSSILQEIEGGKMEVFSKGNGMMQCLFKQFSDKFSENALQKRKLRIEEPRASLRRGNIVCREKGLDEVQT